jgi:hypothetical protein
MRTQYHESIAPTKRRRWSGRATRAATSGK